MNQARVHHFTPLMLAARQGLAASLQVLAGGLRFSAAIFCARVRYRAGAR